MKREASQERNVPVTALRARAISGVKWTAASQVGRYFVQFASNIALAHILVPADFGLAAMATVPIGLTQVLRDLGTGPALIHKQNPSQLLVASVFWATVAVGLVFGIALVFGAPLIAGLFGEPRLTVVVVGMAPIVVVSTVGVVPLALLRKQLRFRELSIIEFLATIVGAASAIAVALGGGGVWSLVVHAVAMSTTLVLLSIRTSAYRPLMAFSWSALREVIGFSANLTGFNFINYFARNADNLLIGRFLGSEALGYYSFAYRIVIYPIQRIAQPISKVLLPVYAKLQGEERRMGRVHLQVMRGIAAFTFPLSLGVLAVAAPLVDSLLEPTWRPIIVLMMILAPVAMAQSIGSTFGSIYQAKGRTDLQLRVGGGIACLIILSFVAGLPWGLTGVTLSYASVSLLLVPVGFWVPFRLIGLSLSRGLSSLLRPLAAAVVMLVGTLVLGDVLPPTFDGVGRLAVLIIAGALCYLASSWAINRDQVCELVEVLRQRRST